MDTELDRNADGTFKVGNPGKPPGSKSKFSLIVQKAITDFLEKNTPKIQETFDQLKPAEKMRFVSDILPYAIPKLSNSDNEQQVIVWNFTLNVGSNKNHPPLDSGIPEENN